MRQIIRTACIASLLVLTGCQGTHIASTASDSAAEPVCPAELQDQVRVSASSIARAIPPDLAVDTSSIHSVLGRRLLVAISPTDAARGIKILASSLTITPLGGIFKGWAALDDGSASPNTPDRSRSVPHDGTSMVTARAIDVVPGQIRIAPFLRTPTLQPQTDSLDAWIAPGGAPLDEMAISAPQLWTANLHPTPPDVLQISLAPLRHVTMYDVVDATITLNFVATRSRSAGERWACSVKTPINLADRDAVMPPLWDLRQSVETDRSELWLALFDPKTGPVRAIFTSPAEATGFAMWLRQTHSTRVGSYQLGLFRPGYSNDARRTIPTDHSVIDSFRLAAAPELNALTVGRLGEP